MLASDVCLVCVHTEQQSVEALAGEDGLLAVGSKVMADKVSVVVVAVVVVAAAGVAAGVGVTIVVVLAVALLLLSLP